MLDQNRWLFTVTDLKQYLYCPRIVYYQLCLPDVRPTTYKIQAGVEAHQEERQRAERRGLVRYNVTDGERQFDIRVQSEVLGLSGLIDEAIITPTEVIPVDYKLAHQASFHYKVQLAAYGMMLQETLQRPARRGFIYLIPLRKSVEISLTAALNRQVEQVVATMRQIVEHEAMPAPTAWQQRCVDCEFRRFCNDV